MDAFWQQRRESTRGINLLEIPNLFAPRETIAPSSIQQQLTIGQPGDKYEQEANQVAEQDDLRLIMPPLKQVGLGHGDESEQARSLTLPSAAPVFATQPD